MPNKKITQFNPFTGSTSGLTFVVVEDGETKKGSYDALFSGTSNVNSFNVVTGLTANTPIQIEHNLNNINIIVQTWLESSNELVDLYVAKFSGDTLNQLIVESTSSDTFRINIIGL